MKSILLKIDDKLFEETNRLVKEEKTSRSNYLKTAIEHYNKWQRKKALEERMIKEIELLKVFDPDKELNAEMEQASVTDLQKHIND